MPRLRGVAVNLWEANPEFASHPFEVYEVGLHHLALHVEKPEQVDEVHGAGEAGGRGDTGWSRGVSLWRTGRLVRLGPDRLKFEVVHMPAAEKAYTEAVGALERGKQR